MSHRGKALGGKYQGIYERTLRDGTKKYTVHIKYKHTDGKVRTKLQTVSTLREASTLRIQAVAQRVMGTISPPKNTSKPKAKLGLIAEQYLASKVHKSAYKDTFRLINGDDGIVSYFGSDFDLAKIKDTDIQAFKEWLDARTRKPKFKRYGPEHNGLLVNGQSKPLKKLANKTKDSYLMYFRALLKKAQKMGLIDYIPDVPFFGNHNRRRLKISLADFCKIFNHLPQPPKPHRAMLLMELFTAQRWSDLAHMKKEDIHGLIQPGTMIEYRSSKTSSHSGIGDRFYLSMPGLLAIELTKLSTFWEKNISYMFFNPKTKKPYGSLKQSLKTACHRSGIEPFEFYQFRHLAATEYLTLLRDPNIVAHILGHRDSRMVDQVYGHVMNRATPGVQELDNKLQEMMVLSGQ